MAAFFCAAHLLPWASAIRLRFRTEHSLGWCSLYDACFFPPPEVLLRPVSKARAVQHLLTLECVDFDVTVTGFEVAEIDVILEEVRGATEMEDPVPAPRFEWIRKAE